MTKVTLNIDKNQAVSVKDNKEHISFIRIGNGKMNKVSKIQSVDLIKLMVDMTKPEIKTISFLIDNIPWEFDSIKQKYYTLGIAYIPSSVFNTKAEQLMFQKGIKGLKDKDLVRKSGRNNYMLNPLAVIPTNGGEALKEWDELVDKTKDK